MRGYQVIWRGYQVYSESLREDVRATSGDRVGIEGGCKGGARGRGKGIEGA